MSAAAESRLLAADFRPRGYANPIQRYDANPLDPGYRTKTAITFPERSPMATDCHDKTPILATPIHTTPSLAEIALAGDALARIQKAYESAQTLRAFLNPGREMTETVVAAIMSDLAVAVQSQATLLEIMKKGKK